MFGRLDTFGDHLPVQRLDQADDAVQDGAVLRVARHVGDEALIDLYLRHRQLFETGQR